MKRTLMVVLWPAFLAAIVAEGLFFSVFDPHDMPLRGWHQMMPAMAVYTLGFFAFWASCALSSFLTVQLLQQPAAKQSRE